MQTIIIIIGQKSSLCERSVIIPQELWGNNVACQRNFKIFAIPDILVAPSK